MMNPIYQAEEAFTVQWLLVGLLQESLCEPNRVAPTGAASRDQVRHGLATTT
jgi:hypothetical protein